MKYHALLSLVVLCAFSSTAKAQLLGADIYPKQIEKDTIEIGTTLYYKCDSQQVFNDTLNFEIIFGAQDTFVLFFSPISIKFDTLFEHCARCNCADTNCKNPYIVKREAIYKININQLGFNSICQIKATITPGKRAFGLHNFTNASGSKMRLSTYIKSCGIIKNKYYNFSLNPSFNAIKDQYYLHAQGFNQVFNNRFTYLDSIVANSTKPIDQHNQELNYKSGFDNNNPLVYNDFPNYTSPFPKGFHLIQETGDLRFIPTKNGRSIIKTRFNCFQRGKLIAYSEREFILEIASHKNQNAPYLTGQNFSSTFNLENFNLKKCFYKPMSYKFKAIDLDKIGITHIKPIIPVYLSKYINAQIKTDTLEITSKLDTFDLRTRPFHIQVELIDTSCILGSSSSFTILLYNYLTPRSSGILSFAGKRTIKLHTNAHDGFKALNYRWNFNGNTYNTADTIAQVKIPGSFKFTLISYGYGGCNDTFVGRYTTPNFPYIAINATGNNFCQYDTISLNASYFNDIQSPLYYWNGQNMGNTFDLVLKNDTTIILKAIFSDSTINYDTVYLKTIKNPIPKIIRNSEHCQGNVLSLTTGIDSTFLKEIDKTVWRFNGKNISDSLSAKVVGEGNIQLEIIYTNSCLNRNYSKATYNINYNVGRYTNKSCPQQSLFLEINPVSNFIHYWYLNDSLVHSGTNFYNLEHANKNDILRVITRYKTSEVSCLFEDTIQIEILETIPFSILGDTVFCVNDSTIDLLDSSFIEPNNGIWEDNNPNDALTGNRFFSPSSLAPANPHYQLEYTTTHPISSCKRTRKIAFEVLPILYPQFVADSIKLCIGGEDILLNSANFATPSNGKWQGDGILNKESGDYFSPSLVGINSTNILNYKFQGSNGCFSSTPVVVTVNLKPNPFAPVRSSYAPRTIVFFDQRDTSDCKVDKWLWDFYDIYGKKCTLDNVVDSNEELYCRYASTQNPVHRYARSGIYPVKLVVEDSKTGIKDSITKYNYIFLLANTVNENIYSSVSIFPNPSKDFISISQNYDMPFTNYRLISPLGYVIDIGKLNTNFQQINLLGLAKGIYLLELSKPNGQTVFTKSVLVY